MKSCFRRSILFFQLFPSFLRTEISQLAKQNAAAHVHGVESRIAAKRACAVSRLSASTAAASGPHYRDAQRAAAAMGAAAFAFTGTGWAYLLIGSALAGKAGEDCMYLKLQ